LIVVVDASAIVNVLIDAEPAELVAEVATHSLAAPHVLDFEVLNVLRRLVRRGEVSEKDAVEARHLYVSMNITRYAADGLIERIWALRNSLTSYDASYVALAEVLDAPLLTCDAKMAKAVGHQAVIRNFGD
jgi:predicted nucleic acid-binding protein